MRTLNAITRILLMLCGDIVALSASDHKTCKKSKRTIVFTKARNQVMNVGEFTDEAIVFLNNNKMERPIEEKKRREPPTVASMPQSLRASHELMTSVA